ncbi:helix-turn-helix transcriptional regulator [Streptomyces fractus]|uniref:helix-turn-helix transcriptional regulator n=1 Tax=Streptomyces fractus TaxID=641806 RepID=UPI003CE9BDCE
MTPAQDRRTELAHFIRSRRERRSPEAAGLPNAGRRRTPGLRREEVATLAGVSITWYTWLEQARDIRVSRQVLGALAGALGLDGTERAHLFRLAGELPPEDADPAPELPHQYRLLLTHLDPNPAFIVNPRFDILAWNRGCELLYGDLGALPARRRNVLWLTFTSPEVRAMTRDWEAEAALTLALFRTQASEGVLAPDLTGLAEELTEASPDFARLWQRRDLAPFAPQARTVDHPRLGEVTLDYVKLHLSNDDKTLVSYLLPPGTELERRFAELAAVTGQATVNPPSTGSTVPVT